LTSKKQLEKKVNQRKHGLSELTSIYEETKIEFEKYKKEKVAEI